MVKLSEVERSMLEHSKYVLIIEDSKAETHLLLQSLKMQDFPARIEVMHSGQELLRSLDKIQEHQPAMILLDLRLPDVDGLTILQTLKENQETAHIPVFIRTGSNNPRDRKICMESGVIDYWEKSMELESVENQAKLLKEYWKRMFNS